MGFKSKYLLDIDYEVPKKINWYFAPIFVAFWALLYLPVMIQLDHLPYPLTKSDELTHPNSFIAERAAQTLLELVKSGPRVVGSEANEIRTIEFLKQEINKIQAQASDFFNFEVDVQVASGSYMHWTMINMYQGVQNVVVKLSAKTSTSDNYLLINTHFDSAPGSPGAGDAGAMVVVMLEVMRIISKSNGPLEHPIVFLFNGAEENPLQASHAFITQHKWAKNCKALINLDAASNGGREGLFQSGPNHSWLMNYYRLVPHPFATSLAEEVFQANLIPSDTDFRIFRDFGGVPGLDMAYMFRGYVYHTEFDQASSFPRESLQNTGDNVLVLATGLANAKELHNTTLYDEGHVVFYDFLGWFMVFYTKTTGVVVNVVVCVVALIAIAVSLYFMSVRSGLEIVSIIYRYITSFAIQMIALALGAGLSLLVALFMDAVNESMSWFSNPWLLFGLYFCPMCFGMGILPALYLELSKNDRLSLGFRIQLFMHSHCLFLIVLTILLTSYGLRSAYLFMICVFFYVISLIFNLITKCDRKGYWLAVAVTICQGLPFLYFTSITQALYLVLTSMTGRSGPATNPEIKMACIAIIMSIMIAGFIIPLFMFFRKARAIILCFLGITLLFILIAVTPAGFPYKPKSAPQRFNFVHAQRTLRNDDNSIRLEEAGIYIYTQDRRSPNSYDDFIYGIGEKHEVKKYCEEEMFCGMPLFNHRWHKAREYSYWVPIDENPMLPTEKPQLVLKSTSKVNVTRKRYVFELIGPDHMTIFIGPKYGAKVTEWSFNDTMLRENSTPPYFIYFSYGKDNTILQFYIELEKPAEYWDKPSLEIGIGGHWIHHNHKRSLKYEKFVESLPNYASRTNWVSSYETWLY